MKLTPDDISTRVFSSSILGGYKKKEVESYLTQVAQEFESLVKVHFQLKERLSEQGNRLKELRDREDLLKSAITTATQTATKMQEEATQKSKAVLAEAQERADLIVQDARDSLRTVYQDLSDLRRVHIQLKNTLKAVLQSHQDLLEQDPIHSLLPQSSLDEDEIAGKVSQTLDQLSKAKDLL